MTPRHVPVFSSRDVKIFSSSRTNYIPNDKTLLILGGRAPDPGWMRDLVSRNFPATPVVWAADSGVHVCRASEIIPSLLIGDKDSASPDDWAWAVSHGSGEKVFDKDKDYTDFQLALSLFEEYSTGGDARALIVSGCFGGALDHLMSVFFTLGSSGGNFYRCMIDEQEGVFFISSGESATMKFVRLPESVSLLPVTDECRGVSIMGVKWPLNGVTLERRYLWAVSNQTAPQLADTSSVTASCGAGILAVYWRSRTRITHMATCYNEE